MIVRSPLAPWIMASHNCSRDPTPARRGCPATGDEGEVDTLYAVEDVHDQQVAGPGIPARCRDPHEDPGPHLVRPAPLRAVFEYVPDDEVLLNRFSTV